MVCLLILKKNYHLNYQPNLILIINYNLIKLLIDWNLIIIINYILIIE